MSGAVELAERAEAADPKLTAQILNEAWEMIAPEWIVSAAELAERAEAFGLFMDAMAYESAAIMLAPSGHCLTIYRFSTGRGSVDITTAGRDFAASASSLALAVVAASLRAQCK